MVRRTTKQVALGLGLTALFFFISIELAYADNDKNRPPDNRPPDRGDSIHIDNSTRTHVGVEAEGGHGGAGGAATATTGDVSSTGGAADATASVGDTSAYGGEGGVGTASASNDGVTVEGDRVENNSTNVVLVPNNNTSDCNRVYGISFGNGEGAGALGVPFRDKACDFEQAADDAAAAGDHKVAWWWRCHKPNLYKTFKGKDDTKAMAQLKCWNSMVQMLEPQAALYEEADYMMAQVTEEQLELVEDKVNKQQNLIQSLKKDHADKDAEIERLKRQAARLRAEQKEQEDKDAARRAAALKALSKKSEGKDDG